MKTKKVKSTRGPTKADEPPVIARRKNMRLTKGEAKDMALDLVANALEGTFAESMTASFIMRMHRTKKRAPSDGERDMFLGEISKVVERLKRRSSR